MDEIDQWFITVATKIFAFLCCVVSWGKSSAMAWMWKCCMEKSKYYEPCSWYSDQPRYSTTVCTLNLYVFLCTEEFNKNSHKVTLLSVSVVIHWIIVLDKKNYFCFLRNFGCVLDFYLALKDYVRGLAIIPKGIATVFKGCIFVFRDHAIMLRNLIYMNIIDPRIFFYSIVCYI